MLLLDFRHNLQSYQFFSLRLLFGVIDFLICILELIPVFQHEAPSYPIVEDDVTMYSRSEYERPDPSEIVMDWGVLDGTTTINRRRSN